MTGRYQWFEETRHFEEEQWLSENGRLERKQKKNEELSLGERQWLDDNLWNDDKKQLQEGSNPVPLREGRSADKIGGSDLEQMLDDNQCIEIISTIGKDQPLNKKNESWEQNFKELPILDNIQLFDDDPLGEQSDCPNQITQLHSIEGSEQNVFDDRNHNLNEKLNDFKQSKSLRMNHSASSRNVKNNFSTPKKILANVPKLKDERQNQSSHLDFLLMEDMNHRMEKPESWSGHNNPIAPVEVPPPIFDFSTLPPQPFLHNMNFGLPFTDFDYRLNDPVTNMFVNPSFVQSHGPFAHQYPFGANPLPLPNNISSFHFPHHFNQPTATDPTLKMMLENTINNLKTPEKPTDDVPEGTTDATPQQRTEEFSNYPQSGVIHHSANLNGNSHAEVKIEGEDDTESESGQPSSSQYPKPYMESSSSSIFPKNPTAEEMYFNSHFYPGQNAPLDMSTARKTDHQPPSNFGFTPQNSEDINDRSSSRKSRKYIAVLDCPPTNAALLMKICQVCQSTHANGLHFGARTCAACAAFFRRSISDDKKYACKRNQRCSNPIEASNQCLPVGDGNPNLLMITGYRKICRACRMKRCLEIGMLPENVQHKRSSRRDSPSSCKSGTDDYFTKGLPYQFGAAKYFQDIADNHDNNIP